MRVAHLFGSSEPPSALRSAKIRWARRPLMTPIGRAVAVALYRGQLSIAVETTRGLAWLPAEQVDSDDRLEAWAQSGF